MHLRLRTDFDIHKVVADLDSIGGTSFFLVPDTTREYLLAEAMKYEYRLRKQIVGQVRQELSGVDEFPPDSPFFAFRDAWQNLLQEKLSHLPDRDSLFTTPLTFNDLSLQLYEIGSIGITSHLDSQNRINLICIFTLTGQCHFCICEDRNGRNPITLNASPGHVILLRAPGWRHSDFRPFHFVADIDGPRLSFGLRQHRYA